jgi:hypothetical protein
VTLTIEQRRAKAMLERQIRDKRGRFMGPQEPDPGPFWIEAPTNPHEWGARAACNVVGVRRPNPDPAGEGGKGFEVVFTGTFAECDSWLEANG